jgi:hypothetical protein
MYCEHDSFDDALEAIEPDYPCTQVGAAYSVERVAALVNIPVRMLRAWVSGQYAFRTFGRDPIKRDVDFFLLYTPPRSYVMGRTGICNLKKCLEKEPKPFPPLKNYSRKQKDQIAELEN